jgi:hypothetical protein
MSSIIQQIDTKIKNLQALRRKVINNEDNIDVSQLLDLISSTSSTTRVSNYDHPIHSTVNSFKPTNQFNEVFMSRFKQPTDRLLYLTVISLTTKDLKKHRGTDPIKAHDILLTSTFNLFLIVALKHNCY